MVLNAIWLNFCSFGIHEQCLRNRTSNRYGFVENAKENCMIPGEQKIGFFESHENAKR